MIDLTPNELQRDLIGLVRDLAPSQFPLAATVAGAAGGLDRIPDSSWSALAESGIFGLTLSEEQGGSELGTAEEFLVFVELGRAIVPGPLVGTALAAKVAADAGHPLASALAAGERRAGILVGDYAVDAEPGDLAIAVDSRGATLYEVTALAEVPATDPTTTVGRPELSEILHVDDPSVCLRLRILVGAYAIGIAEAATDNAVEYAKTREQFGRPIGAFQAVKHRCSEMVIRAYPARVQLSLGAVLFDSGEPDAGRREIAAGHVLAIDAAVRNAEDNIQNHGGIGFTAEAHPGAYLKRSLTYRLLAGGLSTHADEILATRETVMA